VLPLDLPLELVGTVSHTDRLTCLHQAGRISTLTRASSDVSRVTFKGYQAGTVQDSFVTASMVTEIWWAV
jgi:hypothetical protein